VDQDDVPAPDVQAAQALPRQSPRGNLSAQLASRALPRLRFPGQQTRPCLLYVITGPIRARCESASNIDPILRILEFPTQYAVKDLGDCA
jgi:hypothetical protein